MNDSELRSVLEKADKSALERDLKGTRDHAEKLNRSLRSTDLDEIIKNSYNDEKLTELYFKPILIEACRYGMINLVKDLIKIGANINILDKDGENALMISCIGGYLEIVNELINAGSKIDLALENGESAFSKAGEYGHINVVKELIKRSKGLNIKDLCSTALMQAILHFRHLRREDNSEGDLVLMVKIFLSASVDLEKKCYYSEQTALSLASENGYILVVRELIRSGSNINSKDKKGNTPLMNTLKEYNRRISPDYFDPPELERFISVIEDLLSSKADPNIKNDEGYVPLHIACFSQDLDLINKLLSYGADIDVRTKYGETMLQYSKKCRNKKMEQELLRWGAKE